MAERTVLNPAETPSLEDMNLLNINLDFQVFSEAHYQWVPENSWPKDVRDYISEVRRRFDDEWNVINELPEDFNLGLPSGCLLVEPIDQSGWFARLSKYRHLSLNDREVTLISYPTPANDERPSWSVGPPHLAVFEAGKPEPTILEINSYSYEFEAFAHEDEILLVLNAGDRLMYQVLRWSEDLPEFSEPIELFQMTEHPEYEETAIEEFISTKVDGKIHLAWMIENLKKPVYYMVIEPSQPLVAQPMLITDSASALLGINAQTDSIWLHWIDSRFGREGFMPTNMLKWFSAKFSQSGDLIETLVVNSPFDNSDMADLPVFLWSYGSFEVLAWGVALQEISRISQRPIQFSLLNTENHTVSLAEDRLSYDQIIEEAQRQYTANLRNHPIHGISPQEAEECNRWVEWLRQREERNENQDQQLFILRPDD